MPKGDPAGYLPNVMKARKEKESFEGNLPNNKVYKGKGRALGLQKQQAAEPTSSGMPDMPGKRRGRRNKNRPEVRGKGVGVLSRFKGARHPSNFYDRDALIDNAMDRKKKKTYRGKQMIASPASSKKEDFLARYKNADEA